MAIMGKISRVSLAATGIMLSIMLADGLTAGDSHHSVSCAPSRSTQLTPRTDGMHPEWLRLGLSYLNIKTERIVHVGWWHLRSAPTPLFIAIRTCIHAVAVLAMSSLSIRGAWVLPRWAAKALFGIQCCAAAAFVTFGLARGHSSSLGDAFGELVLFIIICVACATAAGGAAAASMLYGAVSLIRLPRLTTRPVTSDELGRTWLALALVRRFHSFL